MKIKLFYWFVWIAILAIIPGCENEDQPPCVDDTGSIIGGENVNQAVASTTVDGITATYWIQDKDGVRKTVFKEGEAIWFGYSFENGGTVDTLGIDTKQTSVEKLGFVRNSKGEVLNPGFWYSNELRIFHFTIGSKDELVGYFWGYDERLGDLSKILPPDKYEATLEPCVGFYHKPNKEDVYQPLKGMRFPSLTLKFEVR